MKTLFTRASPFGLRSNRVYLVTKNITSPRTAVIQPVGDRRSDGREYHVWHTYAHTEGKFYSKLVWSLNVTPPSLDGSSAVILRLALAIAICFHRISSEIVQVSASLRFANVGIAVTGVQCLELVLLTTKVSGHIRASLSVSRSVWLLTLTDIEIGSFFILFRRSNACAHGVSWGLARWALRVGSLVSLHFYEYPENGT